MPRTKDYDILENPQQLRRLYNDQELTLVEIADLEGCSDSSVLKYMEEHGIERRKKGARKLDKHPQWVNRKTGGYLGSWSTSRKKALERDNYQCQSCGASQNYHKELFSHGLDVHHHKPIVEFDNAEAANQLNNLITLCRECHFKYERGIYGPLSGINW